MSKDKTQNSNNAEIWKQIIITAGVVIVALVGAWQAIAIARIGTPTAVVQDTVVSKISLTNTQIPVSTSTATIIPVSTNTNNPPSPTALAMLSCLHTSIWTPYNGTQHPKSDDCWKLDDWGIWAQDGTLLLNPSKGQTQEIYNQQVIANKALIVFTLSVARLTTVSNLDAQIIFRLVPVDSSQPLKDGMQVFLTLGDARQNSTKQADLKIHDAISGTKPLTTFIFETSHTLALDIQNQGLTISLDGTAINQDPTTTITFCPCNFWIGYKIPIGGSLQATISNFSIQQ